MSEFLVEIGDEPDVSRRGDYVFAEPAEVRSANCEMRSEMMRTDVMRAKGRRDIAELRTRIKTG